MVKRPTEQPILITDAPQSQDDQLRRRQARYLWMMSLRAACLIVGAVLVSVQAPLLWLWLSLCGVGMVLLPWLAVLIANDRPPKERHRRANRPHRRDRNSPRSLTTTETPTEPGRVIDMEP